MPVVGHIPERFVSCDPGQFHVGWVEWLKGQPVNMIEHTPEKALDRLEQIVDRLDVFVFERYLLFGWLAAQQVGSEMETSQMIGAIKHVCRRHGVPAVGYTSSQMKALYKIRPLVTLKPRQWPSYGKGGHVKDAFTGGLWFLREKKLPWPKLGD